VTRPKDKPRPYRNDPEDGPDKHYVRFGLTDREYKCWKRMAVLAGARSVDHAVQHIAKFVSRYG